MSAAATALPDLAWPGEHAEEWRDQLRTYFFRASGVPDETGRPIF